MFVLNMAAVELADVPHLYRWLSGEQNIKLVLDFF